MSALNLQALAVLSIVAAIALPAVAVQHTPQYVSLLANRNEQITPTTALRDIARKYDVSLHRAVGQSSCREGKKCIGIVILAGLVESACDFGKGTAGAACSFLCGVFANIAHHVPIFKHLDSDIYSFDVVLMHDSTLPQEAVDQISATGARTLLLDDSIKRKSCHAFLRRNDATSFNDSTCDTAPFDLIHFKTKFLMMFLQQLKLGAMGLFEYDAVAHLDVDMFITDPTSLTAELDYYFSKDMQLMAPMGLQSPLNAGHWIARPSPRTLDLWLKAVTVDGFNLTHGWGNAGMVVPDIHAALKKKTQDVSTKDWSFIGSDRDQGLLYYIFAIVLHGWYAEIRLVDDKRDLFYPKASQVRFTDSTFDKFDTGHIAHLCGHGKPWDDRVCLDHKLTSDRVSKLRLLLPQIISSMETTRKSVGHHNNFVENFCYPRLFLNAKECAAL